MLETREKPSREQLDRARGFKAIRPALSIETSKKTQELKAGEKQTGFILPLQGRKQKSSR